MEWFAMWTAPAAFERVPVVRAGLLAHYSGDDSMAAWFLAHWAERLKGEEFSQLAELARRHGAEFSAIKVAKEGLKRNYVDIDYLFPLNGMDGIDLPVPHELAIAVARQETEFRDSAVSRAGAVGLMQIKPSTAREVAGRIGISGDINRHLRVRETNAMIGAAYLLERLEQFTGSWILTTASYNAGPGRVRRMAEPDRRSTRFRGRPDRLDRAHSLRRDPKLRHAGAGSRVGLSPAHAAARREDRHYLVSGERLASASHLCRSRHQTNSPARMMSEPPATTFDLSGSLNTTSPMRDAKTMWKYAKGCTIAASETS